MGREPTASAEPVPVNAGEAVYDEAGDVLGYVSETGRGTFEVRVVDASAPAGGTSSAESPLVSLPGQRFGSGHLVWRCCECGEVGEVGDGLPETCPGCGAAGVALVTVEED